MIVLLLAAAVAAADVPADAVIHSLDVTGDVMVTAKVGKPRSVDVKGKIEARLDGEKLIVKAPARAEGERPVITLVVDGLDGVSAAGPARLDLAGINGKGFTIATHGAASVTASGKGIGSLVITGDGTSHVDADGLSAAAIDVKLAEAARAEVKATDSLTCNLARASRLTVKGNPKNVKKTVEGVAKLVMAP